MKNLFLFIFLVSNLTACKDAPKTASTIPPTAKEAVSEPKDTATSAGVAADDMVNSLAAFYNGTLPCPNCDALETQLTLNADVKRTYSLEEQYKGKKSKTVESTGTWTVADGIVTLKGDAGTSSYQVTKEGLVSLNAQGGKRDDKDAKKYLLKKVLGE